jgi:aryl-alcohol dehydrogenase-like predicted oxidoreductase
VSGIDRYDVTKKHTISRVIKGGWQLAGGHGSVDREQALRDMLAFVEAGITTMDCADIYTGVEALIGEFLSRHQAATERGELPAVQVHTKYVPDRNALPTLGGDEAEAIIDRSRRRLGMERLDLVQFHWWDYGVLGYVDATLHLNQLRKAGKIKHIGVTNFDVAHLAEILDAGVPVVSNQVQYSVLDQRSEGGMVDFCRQHDIDLLCYGTVAGGFLTDRYLGVSEPEHPLENRSLTKYKLIIDDFGGWGLFQELLETLQGIAEKHGASIATVATRYVLQKPKVAGVIVGARNTRHLDDTLQLFDFALDAQDVAAVEAVRERAEGPGGTVYGLERVKDGKHASIMKYNLNRS